MQWRSSWPGGGAAKIELLVDPAHKNRETPCALEAEQSVLAEEMSANTAQKQKCTPALVEVLRTRNGCLVRLTIGNRQFVTLSGRVELAQPVSACGFWHPLQGRRRCSIKRFWLCGGMIGCPAEQCSPRPSACGGMAGSERSDALQSGQSVVQ